MSEIFVKKSLRVKVNLVRKLSIVSSQSEGGRENSSFSDVNNAGETLLDLQGFKDILGWICTDKSHI